MSKHLQMLEPSAPIPEITSALKRDGGVILRNLASEDLIDGVYAEIIENTLATERETSGTFVWPEGNKTIGGLAAVSPLFTEELLLHPKMLEVVDAILLPMKPMSPDSNGYTPPPDQKKRGPLTHEFVTFVRNEEGSRQTVIRPTDPEKGPNCHHYQLGAAVMLEVHGPGKHQFLHRENSIYQPYLEYLPEMREFIVSVNWAGSDFTLENGATRLVPGSHRWPEDRIAKEDEITQAEMTKGSAVVWLSRTLHGAGASTSTVGRPAFFSSYIADWVRQEENQYVVVPPEIAKGLSGRAQQLIGYRSSDSLGWVKGRTPENLLVEGKGSPI